MNRFEHWQKVYDKVENEFSWYQAYPKTSVKLIEETGVGHHDPIIDIGGGDSHLVDALLEKGYSNLFVLDISSQAIDRARKRLGRSESKVNWILDDVVDFKPSVKFSVWHDRAAFHFLNDDYSIQRYKDNVVRSVMPAGKFILGTFSNNGPDRCSGLPVKQYTEASMEKTFTGPFQKVRCFEELHETPFHTTQLFQFCLFQRVSIS